MATAKKAYGIADYLFINGKYELIRHFTSANESPNVETEEAQYTVNKAKSTETVSYNTVFEFEGVQHRNTKGEEMASQLAVEWLETIGKEQILGEDAQTNFCRVELDNPIDMKENTFYARQVKVSVEISSLGVEAGANRSISGNLNTLEDIVVGEFNTSTNTFTPKSELA